MKKIGFQYTLLSGGLVLFTACPITLQAVQNLFDVPLNLMIVSPAHTPNWDMVADVVNSVSRVYRSPKQCRHRYETVIIPREEGRILYDMNPRKQKKTKGIYKVTVSVGTIHRFTLFLPSLTCVVLSLICLCNLVAYIGLDIQNFGA